MITSAGVRGGGGSVAAAALFQRGEARWMLVLDRKAQEGFWIDGRIYVKVLDIGKRRVKLGIDAPSDLGIVRSELCNESDVVAS
jgi:carbon storage regulator